MDPKESLLPDLANPPRVRRKRAPKHDFKDGAGRVFAHRHDNGGGWVADTAKVADTVKVTRNAQVAGYARIEDHCMIEGRSFVTNYARLSHHVRLMQNARVDGHAILRDRVAVLGNSLITENATITGSSRVENRVIVSGWSQVTNSRITGPTHNFSAVITGNARLLDSNVWGPSFISENAVLLRSTANNARIYAAARLIDSNIATYMTYEFRTLLQRRDTVDPPRQITEYMTEFRGLFVSSQVTVPVCGIDNDCRFIDCRIMLADTNISLTDLFVRRMFYGVTATQPQILVDYVSPVPGNTGRQNNQPYIPQQPMSAVPVVASVGVVHNPETIRQRRIMRLERRQS